jgi:hypothetical protein
MKLVCMAHEKSWVSQCAPNLLCKSGSGFWLFLYPTEMSDDHIRLPGVVALSHPQEIPSAIFSLFKTLPNLSVKLLEVSSSTVTCSTIRK